MGESFWKRAAFCRLRSQEFGAADRQAHRQTSHAKRRDSHASGVGGRSVPQQTIPPQGEHRQELVENNAIDAALSEIMPGHGHCTAGACVGRGEDFEDVRRMRLCWSSNLGDERRGRGRVSVWHEGNVLGCFPPLAATRSRRWPPIRKRCSSGCCSQSDECRLSVNVDPEDTGKTLFFSCIRDSN